ncbi:MAG: C25 family cysteine peptidase [Bacteroidetes bacterium]|nr:C25 family cysteine peptidase [Bacteroidota bacterium]
MKKIFIVLLLFLLVCSVRSQNYNWITPNTTYLKMYVINNGIHRIEKADFTNAGISVTGLDPRTVKVYYKGNQVPIYFYGEGDGTFDDGDYFDFYGTRNYGGLTNTYDEAGNVAYTTNEYYNPYSDTSVYWIGWGGANGLRFADYSNASSVPYSLDYYNATLHFENDQVYNLGQNINSNDYFNFLNDKYKGEGWFWAAMAFNNQMASSFNISNLSNTVQQCKFRFYAYPYNQNTAITNEHRFVVKINATQFDTLRFDDFARQDTTIYFQSSILNAGANTSMIKYMPINSGGITLYTFFDFYEITTSRRFQFDSSYLGFTSELTSASPSLFWVKGAVSSNPISIYDTKNGYRITNYSFSNDTLYFTGPTNGTFEIYNKYITRKPFRVKQKQVPNLVTNSTGADYILVYNKVFETQAEQLRAYRNSHDGFRSIKAEIEDIYDIFNYGMEDPIAVRYFVKNAFENWAVPKPGYLCLFGRGSTDPKRLQSNSVLSQNFVPVFGNPVTDGYFANFSMATQYYKHQIAVGRLPVVSTQEAQDVVNKIIAYENLGLPSWIKKSVFIAGGYDMNEQQNFAYQSNVLINNYISTPPFSASPTRIFLGDSTGMVTYNYPDSAIKSINKGALVVNYMAHAPDGYWLNLFDDPAILSNQNRYPLVISQTCFTGKHAEANLRGYTEKFIVNANKGSIGFIGTTGWSFNGTGNMYNDIILASFTHDTIRRIGDILKKSSGMLDSNDFYNRNTVNCYDIMGDPATKLLWPRHPEFDVLNNDYYISDYNPQFKKNIAFKVYPQNLGTYVDSCKIRFQVLKRNIAYKTKDTIIRSFGNIDTLCYYLSFDTAGDYSLKIIVDPDNWYPTDSKSNNTLVVPVTVKNFSFMPLKPENNQAVYKDTVEITGINPNVDTRRNTIKLLLQFDTSAAFGSSAVQNYQIQNMTGVRTKIKVRLPYLDSTVVYYWRLNSILNNTDTLGWSDTRSFTYHGSFARNDSLILISRYKPGQFYPDELTGLSSSQIGVVISSYTGGIIASSFSGNMTNPTYMMLNKNYYSFIDPSFLSGLIVAKMSKITGSVLDIKHFFFTASTSSDSLANFLSTFDTTHILSLVKEPPIGTSYSLNSSAKALLRLMGSVYADSVNVADWMRWSFVSYIRIPNPIKSEAYKITFSPWDAANSSMNVSFLNPSGTASLIFGPSQTWQNFNWLQNVYTGSSVKFDVVGIDANNTETTLLTGLTSNNFVDIHTINALQYPHLKLVANELVDTLEGTQSPVITGVSLNYIGPPEIALDNNSIFKSDSVVTMGDSVGIAGYYYNIGYVPLNRHIRSFYALDGAGNKVILRTDTVNTPLKVDSSMYVKASFKVNGLPIYKKYLNQIAVVLEIIPVNQNDLYAFNNAVISTFYVKGSLADFQTEVYSDGTRLYGNDYVRANPDLIIKLSGKSIEELINTDTSLFRIMLNGNFISLNGTSKTNKDVNVVKDMENGNFIVRFSPKLQNGINYLNLISNKGETYDTLKFALNVTSEVSFLKVYNFPNPMKDNTTFTFEITGADLPGDYRIKIYSVAGRVIKEIDAPGRVGLNNIYWDGRDADGDYIANGVYFYRLLLKNDSEIHSDVRKLVVLK